MHLSLLTLEVGFFFNNLGSIQLSASIFVNSPHGLYDVSVKVSSKITIMIYSIGNTPFFPPHYLQIMAAMANIKIRLTNSQIDSPDDDVPLSDMNPGRLLKKKGEQ